MLVKTNGNVKIKYFLLFKIFYQNDVSKPWQTIFINESTKQEQH